jgi:hypothetical protein
VDASQVEGRMHFLLGQGLILIHFPKEKGASDVLLPKCLTKQDIECTGFEEGSFSLILDHVGWLLILKKSASFCFVFLAQNANRAM